MAAAAPYTTPLTFRTEVRPYLHIASAGLLVLGAIFIAYYFASAAETGVVGVIAALVGVSWPTSGGSISG